MYPAQCTRHNVSDTMYPTQCTQPMYPAQCTRPMYPAQCIRYNVPDTMYPVQCTRHNVLGTMYPAQLLCFILICPSKIIIESNSRLRLPQFYEFHCSKYLISGMLDGPARPMTGIQGAGYPGTAQVLIYTVQYVQFTVYSVQCMYNFTR